MRFCLQLATARSRVEIKFGVELKGHGKLERNKGKLLGWP